MIHIIDYGLGNLGSVQNMLKRLGQESIICTSPSDLENPTKLILPGVGAFDSGMDHLEKYNWLETLNELVLHKRVPVLGICLGMQLMTQSSEEGSKAGLGWIKGVTKKFPSSVGKVPHMGWNMTMVSRQTNLMTGNEVAQRFYFVHSYYVELARQSEEILSTHYGIDFTSGFEADNILGVQFHPEKSHRFGMCLLANFISNF